MKLASKKKLLIIGLAVLVILILVSVGLFYLKNNNNSGDTQKTVTLCVDDSIGSRIVEDRTMLRLDAKDKLTPLADEIKQKEGHEQSAACLYPLIVNEIQKDQVSNARKYYDLISVAYVEQGSYGAAVGLDAWSPSQFETMVSGMEKNEAAKNNYDPYSNTDYYPTDEELDEMAKNNVR